MQMHESETYTAALRRLVDERASGLLSTDEAKHTVVVRLEDGRTTGIGPLHGEPGALDDPVLRATLVQRLLERLVDSVVCETAAWSFDADDGGELVPVPESLPDELSRRAVDAAASLRQLGPDAVLRTLGSPGMGEAATVVRPALNGVRTLVEVADVVQRPLTAIAGLAVALLSSNRATVVAPDVAPEAAPDVAPEAAPAPTPPVVAPVAAHTTSAGSPTMADLAVPVPDDEPSIDWSTVEEDEEPAMWVTAGDDAAERAPSDHAEHSASPMTSTLTSDDAADDDWADTSWLDELTPTTTTTTTHSDTPAPIDPAVAAPAKTPAAPAAEAPAAEAPAAADDSMTDTSADTVADASPRRRRPRGDDVAEFLRELSRLALNDDG